MIAYLARRWLQQPGPLLGHTIVVIALTGVSVAVAGLVLTAGVLSGFQAELATKFRGVQPHLRVDAPEWSDAQAAQLRHIVAQASDARAYPVVEGDALLQVPGDEGSSDLAVRVWGVEPVMFAEMPRARWSVLQNDAASDAAPPMAEWATTLFAAPGLPSALVGRGVLATMAAMGEDRIVRLTAPIGLVDPVGALRPLVRNLRIDGFFHTGVVSEDDQRVYVARAAAEQLLGMQAHTVWMIYTADDASADTLAARLRAVWPGGEVHVSTWRERNHKLFAALQLEARVMNGVLAGMVLLACCSVIGVIATIVWSKQRHIALLVAVGAPTALVRRVVVLMGAWLGAIGGVGGAALALLATWWFRAHPIALPDAFYLSELPVTVHPAHLVIALVGTTLVAALCASYPARWASRLDIVEGLRAE